METLLSKGAKRALRVFGFEFRETKPNKPNRLKTFYINNISKRWPQQTQVIYLYFYQLVIAIFGLIFEKFGSVTYGSLSGIGEGLCRVPTKPNKPNEANTLPVNYMTWKSKKQTQRVYRTCYQLFASILTPIFRKSGWKRRSSLSGIRVHGARAEGWRFEIQAGEQ